jgi:hypothetical protein
MLCRSASREGISTAPSKRPDTRTWEKRALFPILLRGMSCDPYEQSMLEKYCLHIIQIKCLLLTRLKQCDNFVFQRTFFGHGGGVALTERFPRPLQTR